MSNFSDVFALLQARLRLRQARHCDIGSVLVCNFVQDVLNSTTYFVCKTYNSSQFHFHYNAYEILSTGNLYLYSIDQLIDFQLLSKYSIDGVLLAQLTHFIPTPVDE